MTSRWVVHKERESFDVYAGRPGPWGNPYSTKAESAEFRVATREEAIAKHRAWLLAQPELVAKVKRELKGKVLGCWCAPEACHADVLAEIANAEEKRSAPLAVQLPKVPGQVVCIDTEYDARYTDLGVARLACMTYSFGPNDASIVGPAKAVELWSEWVNDPNVTILGHSVFNDVAVLAQETYRRVEGRDCVPGQGWAWEQAHRLYDPIFDPRYPGDEFRARVRVIDTEIEQRLTQVRFGPHKASVRLGDLAKMLFGEDRSDSKDVPDEAQALLRDAVPYAEWPDDVLARTPWRVKFGWLLETHGEDPSKWPQEAVDYALDDARLPWRVYAWQRNRWQRQRIPDDTRQTMASWGLHVLAIPGWKSDRERAQAIRERYRGVVAHCDRTLVDTGILYAPGRVLTNKRGKLQGTIADAFDDEPPLPKTLIKAGVDPATLTAIERRDRCAADTKTVVAALARVGVRQLELAEALTAASAGADDLAALLDASGSAPLNAHLLRAAALSKAKKAAAEGDLRSVQLLALAEALLPALVNAGFVEVSYPRTIKTDRVADYVYAILGDAVPLTKKAAVEYPNPTPAQRREFCSTDAKTVRAAIIEGGGKLRLVADAVAEAEKTPEEFDNWLADSKQPALNAHAVRSKASKTITNFLDNFDTDRRVRTTYQTLVDTGRTSSRKVNIQQFPRDYDKPSHLHVRGCIVPDPGWVFLVADYSQLELCSLAHVLTRLVRHYARDPRRKAQAEQLLGIEISETYESTLSRAINSGQDCHVLMAAALRNRGETYEECNAVYRRADEKKSRKEPLTDDEKDVIDARQLAKPADFGFPGGLGPRKFIDYAAGYGVTIDLATAKYAKRMFESTWVEAKLYFWHIGQMTAAGDGVTVLQQLYSKRLRGDCLFTQASNGYFQALAADGAKEALRRIIRAAYRTPASPLYGTRPSGFVHDEFLVNCLAEQAPAALPALEYEMVEGMRVWIPDVLIKAPGKILKERWGK